MLKLLAVPELNLRVSDIELSAEMSAGYRHTPTSWLGSTYDPVSMVTELADTLNGPTGQLEQTLVYIDHHSAKDWLATCSSPDYGSEFRETLPYPFCLFNAVERQPRRLCPAGDMDFVSPRFFHTNIISDLSR